MCKWSHALLNGTIYEPYSLVLDVKRSTSSGLLNQRGVGFLMRKRVIFDLTVEQYALIETRAAEAGLRPSAYVRAVALEAAGNDSANDEVVLARLGFSSADQKAAHNKARRAGMALKSYIRTAALTYLPRSVSSEAASRWRQRLVCTEIERQELTERAEMVGLSVGTYLVRVGLGYQPHSVFDHKAVVS